MSSQLHIVLRAHDLRNSLENVDTKGGLHSFIKKEKQYEKAVVSMMQTVQALISLQDVQVADSEKANWEEWMTGLGMPDLLDKVEKAKSACVSSFAKDVESARQNVTKALMVGTKKTWKAGLPHDAPWKDVMAAAAPMLEAQKAAAVTESFQQLTTERSQELK